MELPDNIKTLYRHWPLHVTSQVAMNLTSVVPDRLLARSIENFISERMQIWCKRHTGAPRPYTHDPILGQYRFCNILRELDRQTLEYHEILYPIRGDFSVWLLNMFYARMVARPDTLRMTGLLSFDTQANNRVYEELLNHPRPRYGTPYVFPVSTIMRSTTPTRELFATRHLPRVMKTIAREIEHWQKLSVYDGVAKLLPLFGFNLAFLWTEVLIDVAYQYPERVDLFGRFPVGPGAIPTMSHIDNTAESSLLVARLGSLHMQSGLLYDGVPIRLSAENWEGIGCEYRKYTNLSAGRGRRRLYKS